MITEALARKVDANANAILYTLQRNVGVGSPNIGINGLGLLTEIAALQTPTPLPESSLGETHAGCIRQAERDLVKQIGGTGNATVIQLHELAEDIEVCDTKFGKKKARKPAAISIPAAEEEVSVHATADTSDVATEITPENITLIALSADPAISVPSHSPKGDADHASHRDIIARRERIRKQKEITPAPPAAEPATPIPTDGQNFWGTIRSKALERTSGNRVVPRMATVIPAAILLGSLVATATGAADVEAPVSGQDSYTIDSFPPQPAVVFGEIETGPDTPNLPRVIDSPYEITGHQLYDVLDEFFQRNPEAYLLREFPAENLFSPYDMYQDNSVTWQDMERTRASSGDPTAQRRNMTERIYPTSS